ncbi:hypothetical protein AC739_07995 [Planococcus glaciei]|uniref:hypothetical protein n=1 Tax=Planococcus glaciei TaxID=459472 RepID=UPI00069F0250|nr:hypothetical protein [Planococcus glaciei]KOF10913.1 hypothetical protein AC739_07995 [Planococcus glaciei]
MAFLFISISDVQTNETLPDRKNDRKGFGEILKLTAMSASASSLLRICGVFSFRCPTGVSMAEPVGASLFDWREMLIRLKLKQTAQEEK